MNKIKACNRNMNCFHLFFVMCLILFNCFFLMIGCGLDTFYYVEPPIASDDKPSDQSAYNNRTFRFVTVENPPVGGFKIDGTDVYYKIYSDKNVWDSETKDLISVSNSTSAYGFDKLNDTYKYQNLLNNKSNDDILIPYRGGNQSVEIRLTDYQTSKDWAAAIKINGSLVGVPTRYNKMSFNFGIGNGSNFPNISDGDVKAGGTPGDHKWYVSVFAVTKGHDTSYVSYYSNIVYLGSVVILDNKVDN